MVKALAEDQSLVATIWQQLAGVMDPEIPAVSVVDMGMIGAVDVADGHVRITVLPTFTGCPAIPVIREDIEAAVRDLPRVRHIEVEFSFDPAWTTDRITDEGRRNLADFGLGPPAKGPVLITDIGLPSRPPCPFCGSKETHNENPFGPTPCRALYYCRNCRNPFEQFKPV